MRIVDLRKTKIPKTWPTNSVYQKQQAKNTKEFEKPEDK
jgi:hypothetical protein